MMTKADTAREICPICGRRPIVYAGAHACSPECDMERIRAIAKFANKNQCAHERLVAEEESDVDPFAL